MGETAYIAHACPCDSATPPPPPLLQEERINPLDALGDSVSFGRFINDSLTWDDKWSPFPQKRYVQEAEKHSQPGSVAQKKAFFEAHYKRIAAIKSAAAAAALLQDQQPQMSNHKTLDLQTIMLTSHHNTQENPSNQCLSDSKPVEIATPIDHESPNQLNNTEKNHTVISSITPHAMEKPLEKVISSVTPHAMEKPLEKVISSVTPHEMEKPLEPLEKVISSVTPHVTEKPLEKVISSVTPHATEKPLEKVISSVTPHAMGKPLEKVISSVTPHEMEKPLEKKPVEISLSTSSSFGPVSNTPCSPTKSKVPPTSFAENIVTPIVKISQVESTDKVKPPPQSLRKLFSSSPIREPIEVNIPVAEVVEISKVAHRSSSDVSKDYTASKPTKANPAEMQKHPLKTTLSETKRTKTSPSPCRTKTARSKWHSFLALFSKSLRVCRKKICLSGSSSRKEEMAYKRKQKVPQEKFNDKEALELELQTKFKQVETEVKKLRKSLFSNSKKLPDVYNETANSKNTQISQSSKL